MMVGKVPVLLVPLMPLIPRPMVEMPRRTLVMRRLTTQLLAVMMARLLEPRLVAMVMVLRMELRRPRMTRRLTEEEVVVEEAEVVTVATVAREEIAEVDVETDEEVVAGVDKTGDRARIQMMTGMVRLVRRSQTIAEGVEVAIEEVIGVTETEVVEVVDLNAGVVGHRRQLLTSRLTPQRLLLLQLPPQSRFEHFEMSYKIKYNEHNQFPSFRTFPSISL